MKLPKLTKEVAQQIDKEYNKALTEADSFTSNDIQSEPDNHFELLICDGNGAASRGTENDTFYVFETSAPNLREAINNCEKDIRDIDRFDAYDEDEYEDYYDYFDSLDISGGAVFLAGYIKDGKRRLECYLDDVTEDMFDDPSYFDKFIRNLQPEERDPYDEQYKELRELMKDVNSGKLSYEEAEKKMQEITDKLSSKESKEK